MPISIQIRSSRCSLEAADQAVVVASSLVELMKKVMTSSKLLQAKDLEEEEATWAAWEAWAAWVAWVAVEWEVVSQASRSCRVVSLKKAQILALILVWAVKVEDKTEGEDV